MKQLSQRMLSELIISQRSEKGFTQEQLCSLSGINRTMISRIERLDYIPTIPQLEKLAETLEFDIEAIFVENKPSFYTAFRGSNLTSHEKEGIDYLFDMMLAAKQQILLREALHHEE